MLNDILSIDELQINIELFRRNKFDFISVFKAKEHQKQKQALQFLTDKSTVEISYGGAAGGAKSWTGCAWLAFMCETYPGTKWFIGREELKRLRESTLITFFKVAQQYGLVRENDYRYNGSDHFIQFSNGSRIDLLDLKYNPSDPLYERYGSIEYTGGWIEEAGEVDFGAYDTLKSRIGRHLNDRYGLLRKLFITCNPKKNWVYSTFYKPFKENTLPNDRKFLQALLTDNPHREAGYDDALKSLTDKNKRERLLLGNWDYDDNENALCDFDCINSLFENDQIKESGTKYITADIARFGSDKAIICVWNGWVVIEWAIFDKSKTTEIQNCINAMRTKHGIAKQYCIADEDGVGGGVVDNCGIQGFVNNGSPIEEPTPEGMERMNYQNLQAQCVYKLADKINQCAIFIKAELQAQHREELIQDLETIESYKSDSDGKLRILPKEKVKDKTGRSPDWRDVLMMRIYFELKAPVKVAKPIIFTGRTNRQ
jgi:phage terminase large subunit